MGYNKFVLADPCVRCDLPTTTSKNCKTRLSLQKRKQELGKQTSEEVGDARRNS